MPERNGPRQPRTDLIWRKVLADPDAQRALKILERDGIDLQRGTWPTRIASIPFLPNRRATTRAIRPPRTSRVVIRFLDDLLNSFAAPYGRLEAYDPSNHVFHMRPSLERETPPRQIKDAADLLRRVLSLNWAIAEHNPQHNEIATLRWEVRSRTGQPHDTELVDLLHVVFEAAGFKNGFRMEYSALKKILRNETNTRQALRRKVHRRRKR